MKTDLSKFRDNDDIAAAVVRGFDRKIAEAAAATGIGTAQAVVETLMPLIVDLKRRVEELEAERTGPTGTPSRN